MDCLPQSLLEFVVYELVRSILKMRYSVFLVSSQNVTKWVKLDMNLSAGLHHALVCKLREMYPFILHIGQDSGGGGCI